MADAAAMADVKTAARTAPLGAGTVAVSPVQPRTRLVFRGDEAAAEACGRVFGPPLSREVCRATESDRRAALWLGPDEWLLLAVESEGPDLFAAIEAALGDTPHALVDVSHRQVGFDVAGAAAADLLNSGCPLDLSLPAFPVGMCTRTVLAKADVTLWRRGPDRFRLEVNRSFAQYLAEFLREAERGL